MIWPDKRSRPPRSPSLWRDWRSARERAAEAACRLADSRAEEDLLRHHKAELDALAPEGDEEERLGARRTLMQNAERLGEAIAEAIAEIDGDGGAQQTLSRALRRLERARDRAQGLLDSALAAAERAATETGEALAALASAAALLELDPRALEEVEERLFALRALARKHAVQVGDLPRLRAEFADQARRRSRAALKRSRRWRRRWWPRAPAIGMLRRLSHAAGSARRAGSTRRSRPN